MTETLRDQQRRIAQERILEATAEEILANGLMDLSMQAVADRAGVSHRTVYNHFESKERLVEELAQYASDEMARAGAIDLPDDLDQLPEAIERNWRVFEAAGVKSEALARVMVEQAAEGRGFSASESSQRRTAALRRALNDLRPDLDSQQVEAIMALIRVHVSFHSWYRLTHEFGLDSETAGEVSAWGFRVMRDALTRGEGPFD
ncbi:MAG: TetR/AcrR family transcriptional regulator [Acidimicrobiia bacterium]